MKIGYDFDFSQVVKALEALPVGLQHGCYGAGFKAAGNKTRRIARAKAPVGEGFPLTNKGKPRKRLRDSIEVALVGWHWSGKKVPKSAVVVVAKQPHAHLVEDGTMRMPARPFLYPALKTGGLVREFKRGASRQFGRVVRQIEQRKLTRATARAIRLNT